ncbi:MAG: CRISPR-associated endonuclease Cas3'', partial [Syntrophorhabdus aromaticivorans]|nr:CRISPR-associated endonuclease Cas3'' [Syntrophorhabdus aromaticivorans]
MASDELLAHSPKGNIPSQTYANHVKNVCYKAIASAQEASAFYNGDVKAFIAHIEAAAVYHDLGKLDRANQEVLKKESKKPLPIAHEDAGVCRLDELGQQEAAILVYSHHGGLFSRGKEIAKQGRPFRELQRTVPTGESVADHVDSNVQQYELRHKEAECPVPPQISVIELDKCGFTRRIALSCLVDADHGDTARHYGQESITEPPETRWTERLAALERYVANLPEGKTETERLRNKLRKSMFEACRNASIKPAIRACDAPVGSGKTTAVMSHLLNVAASKKPELRHIIVVLPYTNIIGQAVDVYRKALVLEGEHPQDIVAEHHHRAEFEGIELRYLTTLWKAPIIVTTAVQFFETLGAYHPAGLRKLHELPG